MGNGNSISRTYGLIYKLKDEASSVFFILTIVIAVIFLVYRTAETYQLRSDVANLRNKNQELSGELAGAPTLQKGDIVPSFEAKNLREEYRSLSYNKYKHSLIFVFSVECSACEKQLPLWSQFQSERDKWNYQVIGVAVNSSVVVHRQLQYKEISFDVLTPDDFAIQRAFRTVRLPLTIIVSSQGRVEWFSYGVLTPSELEEVSAFLKRN